MIKSVYEGSNASIWAWRKAILSGNFLEAIKISLTSPGCCNRYVDIMYPDPFPNTKVVSQVHFHFQYLAARVGSLVPDRFRDPSLLPGHGS